MVAPPALATGWIAGSFGSASATEDGGTLVVVAGEAPLPPPSPEQAAAAAAVTNTRMVRARMVPPLIRWCPGVQHRAPALFVCRPADITVGGSDCSRAVAESNSRERHQISLGRRFLGTATRLIMRTDRPRSDARRLRMAVPLSLGPVHHLRLTVTDVERSRAFYTELLGFQVAMDAPPPADDPHHDLAVDLLQDGIVMVNGDLLLGLRPVDAERASDRFDPFRCGLDHLSFGVAGRAELEAALQAFEDRGVEHSEITDLPPFGIAVLPFKDPDGVALELTAPL